ncbi:putative portal protein [Pseudoalteromonas phage H103]|uniref:portal protein n=1 Tax=Pseudoalteromonas phage H103 TaxID=1636200 RepID=UPI0006BCF9C2|nr:portal protein [Pseudoalteromonas phage H103]AKA61177.1 putative portal protein [Pseudoalteromonas phage H103]
MSANDPKAAQAMAAKKEEVDQAIDDFENGINNYLKLAGSSVSSLQSNLADPTGAFTIAMQEACAAQRIPVTELIGFMTGERSSTENSSAFSKRLRSEQNNEYAPTIIKFLQWLVDLGVLPEPNDEIKIKWPDIAEPTRTEKLANAKAMVEMNKIAYEAQEEEPWTMEEIREAAGADKEKPKSEYETLEPKDELTLDENTPD